MGRKHLINYTIFVQQFFRSSDTNKMPVDIEAKIIERPRKFPFQDKVFKFWSNVTFEVFVLITQMSL